MTDGALTGAWLAQMNTLLMTSVYLLILSFTALYLSVLMTVSARFANACGLVGGGSHV